MQDLSSLTRDQPVPGTLTLLAKKSRILKSEGFFLFLSQVPRKLFQAYFIASFSPALKRQACLAF